MGLQLRVLHIGYLQQGEVGGEDVGHEGKQDRGPHVFGYQGKGKENLFQDQDEWSGASWLWMM